MVGLLFSPSLSLSVSLSLSLSLSLPLPLQVGEIQLFEVASGRLLESLDAHSGAVWSVCVAPDRTGFISGSADHDIKFWNFELTSEGEDGIERLVGFHLFLLPPRADGQEGTSFISLTSQKEADCSSHKDTEDV